MVAINTGVITCLYSIFATKLFTVLFKVQLAIKKKSRPLSFSLCAKADSLQNHIAAACVIFSFGVSLGVYDGVAVAMGLGNGLGVGWGVSWLGC